MLWVRATGSIWVISALSHIPWIVHFMTHSLHKVITQPAALGMNVSHWAAAYRIFVLLISLCTQGKAFQAQQEIPQVHPGKVNSAFFEGGWKPVLPHIYWGLGHIWSCDAGMVTWSEKAPRRCSQLCRRVLGAAAASCIFFFFLKLHRRFPGGRAGLSQSHSAPHAYFGISCDPPFPFFLQTSLMSLEWQLGVEVIKGYWSIWTAARIEVNVSPVLSFRKQLWSIHCPQPLPPGQVAVKKKLGKMCVIENWAPC